MNKIVFLKEINIEGSPHVRQCYRADIVSEYAERYKLGKKHGMPLPTLFKVGKDLLIGDGWHRINAMQEAGLKAGTFDVITGTYEDCVKFALGSNTVHGLRRTNADKRQCAILAVTKFPKQSNNALAEMCDVSDMLIAEVRKELENSGKVEVVKTRVGADGREQKTDRTKESNANKSGAQKDGGVSGGNKAFDATGYPLTEKALLVWKRRDEALKVVSSIAAIGKLFEEAKKNKDLLYREVNFNAVEASLSALQSSAAVSVPHAVCPACQGIIVDTCTLCKGRAVISKFKYESTISEKDRKLRESRK